MLALKTNKIFSLKSCFLMSFFLLGLMISQTIDAKLFYDKLSRDISFSQLNERNVLSGPVVNDIEQDIQGFIWIATQDGLNKYDGQNVTHYYHDPENQSSLPASWVVDILSDTQGNLWVVGESGISLYIPEIDGFYNFTDPIEHELVTGLKFRVISQVDDNTIWFGTRNSGIAVFDMTQSKFIALIDKTSGLQSNKIMDISVDDEQNIFVATEDAGLLYSLSKSSLFKSFNTESVVSLPTNKLRSILIDNKKRLWLGSMNSGLILFDLEKGVQQHLQTNVEDPYSICSNSINDIYEDKDGYIYIATESGGLCEWDENTDSFIRYVHNDSNNASLIDDRVISLFQDKGGVFWVGTSLGISKWNRSVNNFQLVNSKTPTGKNLSSDIITSFAEAENGDLYVGTWGEGINIIDIEASTISHIKAQPSHEGALQDDRITTLLIDSKQNLWVGTYRSGLYFRKKGSDKFSQYLNDPEDDSTLSSNQISKIMEIANGNLAVGTWGGGINIITSTGDIQRFLHDEKNRYFRGVYFAIFAE